MNKRFQIILLIVSLFVVVLLYFFLQPRISNNIPFIRNERLNTFINNSIKNNHISPEEFWQLREFYSPGYVTIARPHLTFSADKISSQETIIDSKIPLKSLLPTKQNWHILYENTNEMIASKDNKIYIYFIKPISEMSKANGFFDYKDKDKKLLENKNWYGETMIQK